MRSDREEVPAPFTKEDADRAEIAEARLRTSRAATACQVYWPSWFNVCGEIKAKYDSLGGPGSFLSYPSSGNIVNPGNTGERVTFLNGPIYWSAAGGAHPVVNSFLNRWGILGYEGSYLKYPTTDEIVLPDGGRRQEFQDGAIYVSFQNAIGSAIQNGPLRDKYNSVGGLTPGSSFLGYLTEDHKRTLPDGQGQMARFQNGVIYYSPATGAYPVTGDLLTRWTWSGYEQGSWGYPTGDATTTAGNSSQQFQYGLMSWPYTNAAAVVDDGDLEPIFVDGRTPTTDQDYATDALDGQNPADGFRAISNGGGFSTGSCESTLTCVEGGDPEEPIVDAPAPSILAPEDCFADTSTNLGVWFATRKQACLLTETAGYTVKLPQDPTKVVGRIPASGYSSITTSHLSGKFVQEVKLSFGQHTGRVGIARLNYQVFGDHAEDGEVEVESDFESGSVLYSNTTVTFKIKWNFEGVPQGQIDSRQNNFRYWFTNDDSQIFSPSSDGKFDADIVRCDNTMRTSGGQYRQGCVIAGHPASWAMNEYGDIDEAAGHVLAAQGVGLPGGSLDSMLQRTTNVASRNDNRNQACPRGNQKADKRREGVPTRSCDEYPFASTIQGAAGKDGNGRSFNPECHVPDLLNPGTGYSVCMIDNSENLRAGGQLGGFYGRNRVVHQDSYWVDPVSGNLPPVP
ncbi:NucA/NucB deoxyribonuclease domain-containing protein [Rhodococcus sp. NBC_00294]|uniref:NucA/NucB deoxyribonuclease domain-containing protein n=1 Tax=Rhodococcus sp. NBC_00294 TaxID=2976004 RepID=UPI002E2A8E96|nr:hypothetical protein [Rhodococcus sp. NBC_00294]